MCIMCGCDYVDRIYKIGHVGSLKLIKEHRTIEKVLGTVDHVKHRVPENYLEMVRTARKCFLQTYTHRITREMLCVGEPAIEKIKQFINQFCTLSFNEETYYIGVLESYLIK